MNEKLNGSAQDPADSFIDIGLKRENLPVIPVSERLVPKDFTYGRKEISEEVLLAFNGPRYEGYPEQGLSWTEAEYEQWVAEGKPTERLVGSPGNRPPYFIETHPNRNNPDGSLRNPNVQKFNDQTDASNLHPFFKEAVTSPKGIPTGLGWYWRPGENEARDPVILRVRNGKLQILMVIGKDGRGQVLPGGMVDKKDPALSKSKAMSIIDTAIGKAMNKASPEDDEMESGEETAMRETGEETGIQNLHDVPRKEILHNVVVGDWRATAHAWPVTSVYLFLPNQATSEAMEPQAGDDAAEAAFMEFGTDIKWGSTEANMRFTSHASYVKLAILEWERLTGFVVGKDGTVGIAG